MDAHVTMNGVSQYLYNENYRYSKLEILDNTTTNGIHMEMFTHLLSGELLDNKNFKLIGRQSGFKALSPRSLLNPSTLSNFISVENKIYIYERVSTPEYLVPHLKWAQRRDKILLTIELSNAHNLSIHLTDKDEFSFRGKSDDQWYAIDVKLFDDIGKLTFEPGIRWIKLTLLKRRPYFWTKLSKTQTIKKDWDNWADSENDDDYKPELALASLDPTNIQQWYTEGHGTTETVFLKSLVKILGSKDESTGVKNTLVKIYQVLELLESVFSPIQFSRIVTLSTFTMVFLLYLLSLGQPNESKTKQE